MQDNVISLIQLYEPHRLLWETNEPNYKNKYKRKDSYDSVAKELGVNNTEEVKKKIESLLVQFRREKKAVIPKSEMGTADKKKAWCGYFLSIIRVLRLCFKDHKVNREMSFGGVVLF